MVARLPLSFQVTTASIDQKPSCPAEIKFTFEAAIPVSGLLEVLSGMDPTQVCVAEHTGPRAPAPTFWPPPPPEQIGQPEVTAPLPVDVDVDEKLATGSRRRKRPGKLRNAPAKNFDKPKPETDSAGKNRTKDTTGSTDDDMPPLEDTTVTEPGLSNAVGFPRCPLAENLARTRPPYGYRKIYRANVPRYLAENHRDDVVPEPPIWWQEWMKKWRPEEFRREEQRRENERREEYRREDLRRPPPMNRSMGNRRRADPMVEDEEEPPDTPLADDAIMVQEEVDYEEVN